MSTIGLLARIAPGLVLVALAGCGGGGGDGGMSTLSYSGNTNPAVVTTANAARLTANVMGGGGAAAIIGVVAVAPAAPVQASSIGSASVARSLNHSFRDTLTQARRTSAAQPSMGVTVNETVPCDTGSVHITGTLSDTTGTGNLNLAYNTCTLGDLTLNGAATMQVAAFDMMNFVPTNFTVSFPRLELRAPNISTDIGGSVHSVLDISGNSETITLNAVTRDNNTGSMTKTEDLILTADYDNILFPSSFTEAIQGRSFDSVHGFVDVSTITLLSFGTVDQLFPDSGELLLSGAPVGAGTRNIFATALSSALAKLELDLDADGVRETAAWLKWIELPGPVGADLGDNDIDGMHNSWETVNVLDPMADDAAGNKDGDSKTNLEEYQAGTDPSNPLSF
jgi:hypothetical protein